MPQCAELADNIFKHAIQKAERLFQEVNRNPKGCDDQCTAIFKTSISTTRRRFPSGKITGCVCDDDGVPLHAATVEGVLAPAVEARECTYIADTGAAMHIKNLHELTKAERRQIKMLHEPILMSTANGVTVADKYIEAQIKKLGGSKTIKMIVTENSSSLLSIGQLVLDDGYRFYWEHNRAHLVSPDGDHIWLDTNDYVPKLTSQQMVVNNVNGLEAYALMNAKSQRNQDSDRSPG